MKALIKLAAFVAVTLPSLSVLAEKTSTEEVREPSILDNFHKIWPPNYFAFWATGAMLLILFYLIWKSATDKGKQGRLIGSAMLGFTFAWPAIVLTPEGSPVIILLSVLAAISLALLWHQGGFKGFPKSLFDKTETPEEPGTPANPTTPGQPADQGLIHCRQCNTATRGKKFCVDCFTPRDPSAPPPDNGGSPPPAPATPTSLGDLF